MKKVISLVIIFGGTALTIYGAGTSELLSSELSRAFVGSPSDNALWILISGIALIVIGIVGIFRGLKRY